jgi:hypothetical protein
VLFGDGRQVVGFTDMPHDTYRLMTPYSHRGKVSSLEYENCKAVSGACEGHKYFFVRMPYIQSKFTLVTRLLRTPQAILSRTSMLSAQLPT